MVIQVIIRLTLYLDQAIIRNHNKLMNETLTGIENTVSEYKKQLFPNIGKKKQKLLLSIFSMKLIE